MKKIAAPETEPKKSVSFEELFGNSNAVQVDLGCGKGKFALMRSEECPEINFLGVDRVGKWMKIGATRGEKRKLSNLRFLKTEVRDFLSQIPLESVEMFHIYFPDPWPKRRHHKRRLITGDFLRFLYPRLEKMGFLQIATDDLDYYTQIQGAAQKTQELWRKKTEKVNQRIHCEMLKTNYELKYERIGKPLYYMELQK